MMQDVVQGLAKRGARGVFGVPPRFVEPIFGAPPVNDRGAPLDPQLHVLLSLQETLDQPELHERGVEGARAYFRRVTSVFDLPTIPVAEVRDRRIEGPGESIGLRIYRPRGAEQLPACVFYHGGGFVVGDLDTYDGFCRALAVRGQCTVISVDYRLAPKHSFPAAIEDGTAAFRWVADHANELGIDPDRIAVGGDSAGGNIATVVCQRQWVDGGTMPDLQLLIYPKTDQGGEYSSRQRFAEGFYLTGPMLDWFSDQYLEGADVEPERDPRVSPIQFDDLGGLPETLLVTAGFDPLRDEGRAYARRLREAGVDVALRRFDRLVHGFVTMGGVIDAGRRAIADIGEEFSRMLHACGG